AVCIGATFPLAVRVLAVHAAQAGAAAARAYAWSTVGAGLGAVAGGLWLLPALRYEGTVRVLFVAGVLLAAAAAVGARPRGIGLGAGKTVEDVPPSIGSIDVVEREPEMVRANRVLAGRRLKDPLADPRVRLSLNDARSALLLTERHFDAVVSQPSHPWTAGASYLFTREFFTLVRDR